MTDSVENRDRKSFWAIALIMLCAVFMHWELGRNTTGFDHIFTRITLTAAGCEYVQRQTGLTGKLIGQNGLCEMDVEYTQYQFSSGSKIFYGHKNSQSLHIFESQVVGAISLPDDSNKHLTPEQKASMWRILLAMIIMLLGFIVLLRL